MIFVFPFCGKKENSRRFCFQVNKERRWEEVASSLNPETVNVNYPNGLPRNMLERAYAYFLYQFEQIHSHRAPPQQGAQVSAMILGINVVQWRLIFMVQNIVYLLPHY